MSGADPLDIFIQVVTTIAAVVICLVVHEVCHGLAAYALGDPTAKRMGRFSFNPVRHIDPIGGLMLLFVGFGWAKPVQVDSRYFQNPKRDMALTALAGPVSNFIMAFFAAGILFNTFETVEIAGSIHFYMVDGIFKNAMFSFLQALVFLNIGLGVFNLIPIPPLDGSKVLATFLPGRIYWTYMQYERYGMFVLLFLMMTGSLSGFLGNFINGIFRLMLRVWL
jgi:Zn-dependent protease